MNRRTFIRGAATAASLTAIPRGPMNTPVTVVIIDDADHALLDTSPTPNFDRWRQGAREYRNFWTQPRCAASRGAFYSGLEPHHPDNLLGWGLHQSSSFELKTGATLAEVCPGESALVGKVHTGNATDWPVRAGFNDGYWTTHNLGQSEGSTDYYNSRWWDADGVSQDHTIYATGIASVAAKQRIQLGVPLVIASFHAPHVPLNVPPQALCPITWAEAGGHFTDTTEEGRLQLSRAMMEAWDTCMSEVYAAAVAQGHTLMILSDNGSSKQIGGGKSTLYEAGINAPLFVSGPGVVPGYDNSPVQITDIYATVCELRGGSHGSPHSISFVPTFGGGTNARDWLHAEAFKGAGVDPYTLPAEEWGRAIKDPGGRWKLILLGSFEFYDLENDPYEQDDLYGTQLDSEQSAALNLALAHMAAHYA